MPSIQIDVHVHNFYKKNIHALVQLLGHEITIDIVCAKIPCSMFL